MTEFRGVSSTGQVNVLSRYLIKDDSYFIPC